MCSSSLGVVWTISGFGSGVADISAPVSALSYAAITGRVETSDATTVANPSIYTVICTTLCNCNASTYIPIYNT